MECPFEFDDADMEIDDSENGENSHPNISTVDDTIRKRDRGLRGKAFRFSGKITGFTFSGSSQHDRIQELNTELGHRFLICKGNYDPLKWISYVILSFEVN
jgi:hypothetical protein